MAKALLEKKDNLTLNKYKKMPRGVVHKDSPIIEENIMAQII